MLCCNNECSDVTIKKYFLKGVDNSKIKMIIISECCPENMSEYFDGKGLPKFIENTNVLFSSCGKKFKTYDDYLKNGIYLTTALKCAKKEYSVSAKTIENCSCILEKEIGLFDNVKVIMLMGDFAIKAMNYIWKRQHGEKIIPSGSTYKIRGNKYIGNGIRFFPSYTQTGDSFGIEKSKVKMMIEDVQEALEILK